MNENILQFPSPSVLALQLKDGQTRNGNRTAEETFSADDLIPPEHRATVDKAAQTIRSCLQDIARYIFQAGKELATVKQLLGHGRFGCWLRREFAGSERLAEHWMNVYQRLGYKVDLFVKVKPTVLYYLAMPSTPEKVIRLVEQKLKAGEKLTVKEVLNLIAACKEPQMDRTESPHNSYATSGSQETTAMRLQQALFDALKLLGNRRVQECEWVLGQQGGSHLRQIRVDITELIKLLEIYERRVQGRQATTAAGPAWSQVHDEWDMIDIQPFNGHEAVLKLPMHAGPGHVIDGKISSAIKVALGCTVYVQDTNSHQEMRYTLVEEIGDPEQGRINTSSPVGKALLGKSVGDVTTADTPSGKVRLTILRIQLPDKDL